jgi:hypothetical protein
VAAILSTLLQAGAKCGDCIPIATFDFAQDRIIFDFLFESRVKLWIVRSSPPDGQYSGDRHSAREQDHRDGHPR